MTRKEAREQAFVLVFEKEFNDASLEEIIENATEARDIVVDDYVKTVFEGVSENKEEIDRVICDNLKGWTINRLSKVALAALRVALYEIIYYEEIPTSVAINEAVEIIKKYATKDDAAYVNGVLGTVAELYPDK